MPIFFSVERKLPAQRQVSPNMCLCSLRTKSPESRSVLTAKRPLLALDDVHEFPFIELTMIDDVPRNQARRFIRVQRPFQSSSPQLARAAIEQHIHQQLSLAHVFARGNALQETFSGTNA